MEVPEILNIEQKLAIGVGNTISYLNCLRRLEVKLESESFEEDWLMAILHRKSEILLMVFKLGKGYFTILTLLMPLLSFSLHEGS